MAISQSDKRELAEVMTMVVRAELKSLEHRQAEGFAFHVDTILQGLCMIFEGQNEAASKRLQEHLGGGRTQQWLEKVLNR